MPAQYEAIKRKLLAHGMSLKEAKKHAAMMYNADHEETVAEYDSRYKKKKKYYKHTMKTPR